MPAKKRKTTPTPTVKLTPELVQRAVKVLKIDRPVLRSHLEGAELVLYLYGGGIARFKA